MSGETASNPFYLDTSQARALSEEEEILQLEDLWNLRGSIARLSRELFRLKLETEEKLAESTRTHRTNLRTTVEFLDGFRRLLADARAHLASGNAQDQGPEGDVKPAKPMPKRWFSRRSRGLMKKLPASEPVLSGDHGAWLDAFGRLLDGAMHQMEGLGVHHVPLVGQDLNTLEFTGQRVKNWVAVKNRPSDRGLIVEREIHGLWVLVQNNTVGPLQTGEVIVGAD